MPFPELERYLARLYGTAGAGTRVWADAAGRAQGRYFNSTLTSAFQSIRALDTDCIVGHEGFARSYSGSDQGLCVWKLLDHAASDDESVELDRLCRMLHSINFFRQPEATGGDLYLSVHARLMAAVDGNHGMAFRRILDLLELPQNRVVLQLPAVPDHLGWLVGYVADNYRRNGFRIALNAVNAGDALALMQRVRPEAIKLDGGGIARDGATAMLLSECARRGVRVIFKRIENAHMRASLDRIAADSDCQILAQGFLWDLPQASLMARNRPAAMRPAAAPARQVGVG